jgi:hypothetical protein
MPNQETYSAKFYWLNDLAIIENPSIDFLFAVEKICDIYLQPSAISMGCDILLPWGEIKFDYDNCVVTATVLTVV